MRLIHLCNQHWGAGSATGVPRFSRYFKMAFPEAIDATPRDLLTVRPRPGDVVVADNHLSLLSPPGVKTIVVHHGCAQTHFDRDPSWRGQGSRVLCHQQKEMFNRPHRVFVAPSRWVAGEFARIAPPSYRPVIIPHWVPVIVRPSRPPPEPPERAVVIGDWRNTNKGADVIEAVRRALPRYEFRQLDFPPADDAAREAAYQAADAYLCLSMSEGAPYSVADAEAASLPIITTEVGNHCEFHNVFPIKRRDDPDEIGLALDLALSDRRVSLPGMYDGWTLERWRATWNEVIE